MNDVQNAQTAPWPSDLADLVNQCTLNPGWEVTLEDIDRGQGSKGLTLVIHTKGYDAYHPERGEHYGVLHYFIVPAASYGRRAWMRWLFDRYIDVLVHEGMEFFVIDGKRPFPPTHGDGEDPYTVHERMKDADARRRPGEDAVTDVIDVVEGVE